jgi:hypothetical protein
MLKIIGESLLIATRMHQAYAPRRDDDRHSMGAAEAARAVPPLGPQPAAR